MRLEEAVWEDPDHASHAVCFRNTNVPISALYEYLEAEDLEGFYKDHPDVSTEMVQAVCGFGGAR